MRSVLMAFRFVLLLASAWTCAGCFAFSTVVTVKGDGSGTIQQRILFPPVALAQVRGLAGRGGATFDPLSEQQARARATAFGAGVTYVSSMAIDTSDGRGRDMTYAFTDINQVRLDEWPPLLDEGIIQTPDAVNAHVSFALTPGAGGHVLLHLHVPQPDIPDRQIPPVGGAGISPDQMAMFRQMFAGGHLSLAVEPAGDLVQTNSPYVDGRLVTLIDVDLDEVFTDDDVALLRLQAAGTPDAVRAALQDFPNAKLSVGSEITIEFAPASGSAPGPGPEPTPSR